MAINTSNNKFRIITTSNTSGLATSSKFSDINSPALVVNTSEGGVFYADGNGGTSLKQLAALPNHSHDSYLSTDGGTINGSITATSFIGDLMGQWLPWLPSRNANEIGTAFGWMNTAQGDSNIPNDGAGCIVSFDGGVGLNTMQFFSPFTTNILKYRSRTHIDNSWKEWKEVAFTDSNVASATKLQTPRTIWGQSFDGTGAVNGVAKFIFDNKQILIESEAGGYTEPGITFCNNGAHPGSISASLLLLNPKYNGNVAIGGTTADEKLHVYGNVKATKFIGDLQGDADSATYAQNATYLYASDSPYRYGDSSPYYLKMRYNVNNDNRWYLSAYPETPKSVSVDYAIFAGTATNSNGLAGYTWESKQNSVDTWVPVFSGHKLQYRVIPTAYNGAPSTLTVGDSNRLAGYNESHYYRTARGSYDGENDLTQIPTISGGYTLTHSGWSGAAFVLQATGSSSNLGFIIRGGARNMPELITAVDANSSSWINKGTLITSSNYTTYCASVGHTHSYLPISGGLSTGNWIGLTNNTYAYISLYNSTLLPNSVLPEYGIAFATTTNTGTGKHGSVQGDWATYLTMHGANNRGWIFRHSSSNVASISSAGIFTGANFITDSDERLKDFVDDISVDFDKLKTIPKKTYYWKDKEKYSSELQIGTSAQELQKIYPECVSYDKDNDIYSVDYQKLSIVALAAIDKLNERLEKLEKLLNSN